MVILVVNWSVLSFIGEDSITHILGLINPRPRQYIIGEMRGGVGESAII